MDDAAFRRILTAFADTPADLDLAKGQLMLQVRDELIEVRAFRRSGSLVVEEEGTQWPAARWVITRLARLPLLADRILTHVPQVESFVEPSGRFVDQFERRPDEVQQPVAGVLGRLAECLSWQPAGASSVVYLTSDAGEGKTSVINQLARMQARAYKEKTTDWLLVPVPLGGRSFLRFDDVVVGALVNRLRFPLLYFDAFIELVRMGVVVPAFDGFEEMFVEGAAGDAVSALGNLMQTLGSAGNVLIAARTAYFEYKRLETQSRLFDALGSQSVSFSRLALDRWDQGKFLEYARLRGVKDGLAIHKAVSQCLGEQHPLLQRAVLVRRLLDVATEAGSLDELLAQIQRAPEQYFGQFVTAILVREAREKWIDRSGEPPQPLLSVEEHCELLSWVANEMWLSQVGALGGDVLDLAAELFCDAARKAPGTRRQVSERLKQHALLAQSKNGPGTFSFDHEEFYYYFLGRAVARTVVTGPPSDTRHLLSRGLLPRIALDTTAVTLPAERITEVVQVLGDICHGESGGSFVKENSGCLAVRILSRTGGDGASVRNMVLSEDSLQGRTLRAVKFENCYIYRSSLAGSDLEGSTFQDCTIERLDLNGQKSLGGVTFTNSPVAVVTPPGADHAVFDPAQVQTWLQWAGAVLPAAAGPSAEPAMTERDQDLILAEKVIRKFLRATQINENTLRQHLGARCRRFMDDLLPDLLKASVLQQVEYHGSGQQDRFKLGLPLRVLEDCLARSGGSYEEFVHLAQSAGGRKGP